MSNYAILNQQRAAIEIFDCVLFEDFRYFFENSKISLISELLLVYYRKDD